MSGFVSGSGKSSELEVRTKVDHWVCACALASVAIDLSPDDVSTRYALLQTPPLGTFHDLSATRKMKPNEDSNEPVLISRLKGQKYPPPIPTLGNLEHFLVKPFEALQPADSQLPENSFPVPGPLDPTKRDGLLSYAYSLYDTFMTGESPAGPDGPVAAHAPMLLPLLELLHGLDSSHLQTALLLGCVYHRQGFHQRALDVNREVLERYPNNVCCSL